MILKAFRFTVMACLTLLLLWGIGWLYFITSVALTKQPAGEKLRKTDAIVVVTGGTGRIQAALGLLDKKMAPTLFISGVNKDVKQEDILKNGQKDHACCIVLGYEAEDTQGNALEIKNWTAKNNINSIRLVTSSYHMSRTHMEVWRQAANLDIIPHPIVSDDFQNWKGRFWSLTFSEYNKILFSWMKSQGQQ